MVVDSKAAIKLVQAHSKYWSDYQNFYEGSQSLTYSSREYRKVFAKLVAHYVENMSPSVIEPMVERLEILGLEIEGSDSNDAATALWDIWRDNRMELQHTDVHNDALVCGNAYLLIWPDRTGTVKFYPQYGDNFAVHYDDDGNIDWAVKLWKQEDNFLRLTTYERDFIRRYISRNAVQNSGGDITNTVFIPLQDEPVVRNRYSRVPVFHFANNAPIGDYGISELKDVVPIQEALNKAVADLLVAMEFNAYPQRWAAGIEVPDNEFGENQINTNGVQQQRFKPGQDRMLATANENARFGEFSESDLSKYIEVHDMYILNIARVTGTPMHNMLIRSTVFPSGEALKTAEQRFISKIKNRQLRFGETWRDALSFAAEIAGISLTDKIDLKWQLASPRSDKDFAEIATQKKEFGVSNKQLQREAGYTEAQIEEMAKEKQEEIEAVATQFQQANPQQENNLQNTREAAE